MTLVRTELREVPNAKGAVFLIPQIHKSPGSKTFDSINDSAEVNQKEIYKIISQLLRKDKINIVAIEGVRFGEISQNKINNMEKKIELNSALSRDTILSGAPLVLKAEGLNFGLYGAENANTLEESSKILEELTDLGTKITSTKFREIIIDRRNEEAAKNLSRLLEETKEKKAILQFGASHMEGLIKELNNLGLNVVVLISQEVAIKLSRN